MSVTGTVVIDATIDDDTIDRVAAAEIYQVPTGSRVILDVGSRTYFSLYLIQHLRTREHELHFDVHGTTAAVTVWTKALNGVDDVVPIVAWSSRWSA